MDLLIIGEMNLEDISTLISEAEKEQNHPIKQAIFTEKEWKEKCANNEPFSVNVEKSEKIVLVGGEYTVSTTTT